MISSFSYDVFLSFRGEDTRQGFTGNLYNALCDKGIHTFIDDEELQRGNQITPSLLKAIQQSKIAIVVLSKNYASSSFCLDELVHILHCSNDKGTLVLPVFYEVDPSDVRNLKGKYGEAFAKHEKKYMEMLDKWKIALQQVANLSGWHFKHGVGYEYKFIKSVVGEVSNKINCALLHVADFPVGLEFPVLQIKSLLYDGLDDGVCMVGIHGIGGIGKTTLARAVCNSIGHQFEGLCFLEDVRKKELVNLQKILLSEIIGDNDIQLGSVNQGIPILKHRLSDKKVLLVVDDVDCLEQLRAIVGGPDWFGTGSKVIITTRDKHLLTSHGVRRTYEVEVLNEKDALEMLSWNAFKINKVDPSYEDILKRAVTYASGLPLALEVIGSNLFGKRIEEWESALNEYERIPNKKIQDILKVSFDSLENCQQNLFLDIACCFKGYKLSYLKEIIYAHHGGCQEYGIGVLIEKSLVKIDVKGCLTLHDLIEDMGKEIVRQESPEEPSKRSRLWFHDDIVHVLEENVGTGKIQIITLDVINVKVEVEWDGEAFKEMKNLKTLIIRGACFSTGPKHLPNSLRVLEWTGYPSPSLPSDFNTKKLVKLKLHHSCLTSVEVFNIMSKKNFVNLTALRFDGSQNITEIPDVSIAPNLETLSFSGCANLIKIHESVGFLDNLRMLEASDCEKLRTFPPIKLASLEYLDLSYCKSLERFPEILGNMENITALEIFESGINELPFSIHYLTRLQTLVVSSSGCHHFPSFPRLEDDEEDEESSNMKDIDFLKCNLSHQHIPKLLGWPANLNILIISDDNITIIPASIKECHSLRRIELVYCKLLREIEGIPPNLEELYVNNCILLKVLDLSLLPAWTNECRYLRILQVWNCKNLQEIIGIPSNLEHLKANNCKSLSSICMLLNIGPYEEDCEEDKERLIDFHKCNLSHQFLPKFITWSANLKMLTLRGDFFTIIPTSVKECRILRNLWLDHCNLLREIEGIPPNLKVLKISDCLSLKVLDLSLLPEGTNECCFLVNLDVRGCMNLQKIIGIPSKLECLFAQNCKSLSYICRNMLLDQELCKRYPHTWLYLPSIYFKFPPRSLCYLIGLQTDFYDIKMIINETSLTHQNIDEVMGKGIIYLESNWLETGPIYDEEDVVRLENGWNHFKYSLELHHHPSKDPPLVQIGLNVFKLKSYMDIRFTNPRKRDVSVRPAVYY